MDVNLEYYGLDPCNYFSSPRLSSDAMLKMTGVKLDLISDTDIYFFVEKGMRRVFLIFARGIAKLITNTWNCMILVCQVMSQLVYISLTVDLNG